ncbi:MAG: ATP-binding protein [bacterium]|nr:ATP-binding protein [bacterium]
MSESIAPSDMKASKASKLKVELESAVNELRLQKFAIDEHAIVAITDPSGVITYVNDKFCTISKYAREELLGQTHRVINSGHHPKSFFVDMWRTIASGETWHGEVCNRAKDGTLYWVDTTIVPFKDADGSITSYTAIRADITERKTAEEGLARANEKLQKTNEELEQFVYTASHDLKSPIVTLQGYLDLIRKDIENVRADRVPGFIDRLDAACGKLRKCVNDLLELSRAGYVTFRPEKVSMREFLAKLLRSHDLEIREIGVDVRVQEELPDIVFDRQRLVDVLDNLVTNALKYGMTAEEPVLSIHAQETDSEIHFCVEDNGAGLSPDYHDRIFNIFERIDTSRGGTGIGLAIVKKIMTNQEGRVWIESEPGEGAAFWLAFPKTLSGQFHPLDTGGDHEQSTNSLSARRG